MVTEMLKTSDKEEILKAIRGKKIYGNDRFLFKSTARKKSGAKATWGEMRNER